MTRSRLPGVFVGPAVRPSSHLEPAAMCCPSEVSWRLRLIQFDHHCERVSLAFEGAKPEPLVERSGGVVALHAEGEPVDVPVARFAFKGLEQCCADPPTAVGREDGD